MVNVKQTYTLVDPTTEAIVPEFQGAPRLPSIAGANIGLIDDSKRNADAARAVCTTEYILRNKECLRLRFVLTDSSKQLVRWQSSGGQIVIPQSLPNTL